MEHDSLAVDALLVAAALKRRFPPHFHVYIEQEMWEAIGDYLAACGGHATNGQDGLVDLIQLSPILCICPMREMGLAN